MIQPHQAAPDPQPLDDPSDWLSIRNELQASLPGELVEIVSPRLKVEAVIAKLDIGDVVRNLSVHALTPGNKEIVRYDLNPPPSGSLASTLAAIISKAKDKETPAELVVRSIHECLHSAGQSLFRKLEPTKNPLVLPTMEREIPEFERFVYDPLSMDTTFWVDRVVGAARVRAVAVLHPDHRYTLVHAYSYPLEQESPSVSAKFKVRCPSEFWEGSQRTKQEIIANMHAATWVAMETLATEGVANGSVNLVNPEIDSRLRFGKIDPVTCDTIYSLPSGARVLVEEGDSLVCIRVESSADADGTSFFWRITAADGLLLPDDTRLITARSAAERLAEGEGPQRRAAIQTLDRLEHSSPNRLPLEALRKAPFDTLTIAQIAGFDIAQSLSNLTRSVVNVVKPNSELLVLDLLDGIHAIKLSFRDPGHNRMNPHNPDALFLGFRNDGSLKVTIVSPLRNHLETIVPASYFDRFESMQEVVGRITTLFDKQTNTSFLSLRGEIERLSRFGGNEKYSSAFMRPALTRYPLSNNISLNRALKTASEMALVYEADVPASITEVQMVFNGSTHCEMVITNSFATPPLRMHLQVSEIGAHNIKVYTADRANDAVYSFPLETPLTLPEGRQVLTRIFKLLHAPPGSFPIPSAESVSSFSTTPLFNYLKGCEARFKAR